MVLRKEPSRDSRDIYSDALRVGLRSGRATCRRSVGSSASLGPLLRVEERGRPLRLDALMPREGARRDAKPPPPTYRGLLTWRAQPTIGCRQYADRQGTRGSPSPSPPCKSTWWPKGWVRGPSAWPRRRPSRRDDRIGGADAERKDEPSGSAWQRRSGELVCLDSFYIGKLKGVGKVYQLTASTSSPLRVTSIVLGSVNGA